MTCNVDISPYDVGNEKNIEIINHHEENDNTMAIMINGNNTDNNESNVNESGIRLVMLIGNMKVMINININKYVND